MYFKRTFQQANIVIVLYVFQENVPTHHLMRNQVQWESYMRLPTKRDSNKKWIKNEVDTVVLAFHMYDKFILYISWNGRSKQRQNKNGILSYGFSCNLWSFGLEIFLCFLVEASEAGQVYQGPRHQWPTLLAHGRKHDGGSPFEE